VIVRVRSRVLDADTFETVMVWRLARVVTRLGDLHFIVRYLDNARYSSEDRDVTTLIGETREVDAVTALAELSA
jgi:hypothetical protein